MREILFRGKEKGNGGWVEGGIVQGVSHELWQNAERAYITVFPQYLSTLKLVEVDPATVGQFTGLTDKNGKKVFEGDILQNEEGCLFGASYRFRVEFCRGRFYGDSGGDLTVCSSEMYLCEVIGNIYDNLELMEVRDADY